MEDFNYVFVDGGDPILVGSLKTDCVHEKNCTIYYLIIIDKDTESMKQS